MRRWAGDGTYCRVSKQNINTGYGARENFTGFRRYNNLSNNNASTVINVAPIIAEGVRFANAFEINPADDGQLYTRSHKRMWRSTDSGLNWGRMWTNLIIQGIQAIAVTESATNPTLYFGGKYGRFYRFDNADDGPQNSQVNLSHLCLP